MHKKTAYVAQLTKASDTNTIYYIYYIPMFQAPSTPLKWSSNNDRLSLKQWIH